MKRAQTASKQARRKIIKSDGLAIRCVSDPAEVTETKKKKGSEKGQFLRMANGGVAGNVAAWLESCEWSMRVRSIT